MSLMVKWTNAERTCLAMPEECVTEEKNSKNTLMTAQGSDPHIGQVMDCTRFSSLQRLLSATATVEILQDSL